MEKRPSVEEALLSWPRSYDDETDPFYREEILQARMNGEHDAEDEMRARLYSERYDSVVRDGVRADHYLSAWMTLQVMKGTGISFFNRKTIIKRAREAFETLRAVPGDDELTPGSDAVTDRVLRAEWRNLALTYIKVCLRSKTYGSILGLIPAGDASALRKLAEEIDSVIVHAARAAELYEETAMFRNTVEDVFVSEVENGRHYLAMIRGEQD